ncbi:MAG: polymer-forming cytoskeletal protein [Microscillaceae bacterium]|nr:polymer-forming cytoskeletal protein [Microscillaceae bacterium]
MAMFGNNPRENGTKETPPTGGGSQTQIGKGARFVGSLELAGNLRLDGQFEGSIVSQARVVLGENALLKGDLKAQNAEISGEVDGTLMIDEILTLKATAVLKGDIHCSKLIVEPGALFDGKCNMSQPAKDPGSKGQAPKMAEKPAPLSDEKNATKQKQSL